MNNFNIFESMGEERNDGGGGSELEGFTNMIV